VIEEVEGLAGVDFEGLEVEYTVLPGEPPFISHGEFRLRCGAEGVEAEIAAVVAETGATSHPIEHFYLYDADDNELDNPFRVGGDGPFEFRITFPAIQADMRPGVTHSVHATCTVAGEPLQATSTLLVTQEL
jgi:hypothetical protein